LKVENDISQADGIKPMDDAIAFARHIDEIDDLMIVSHLPFLERLTACMTSGNPETTVFKFQSGGIVCMEQLPAPYEWVIKWALMPNIS